MHGKMLNWFQKESTYLHLLRRISHVDGKKYMKSYNYKLSVDTENDFLLVKQIFKELENSKYFSINEVVDLLIKKPHLLDINIESRINSGYLKSLKNDKEIGG